MAQNFRRRILGTRQDLTSETSRIGLNINSMHTNRITVRIDRRFIEKLRKQLDQILKHCQMPKLNLKNSPPYLPDILPDLYKILHEIMMNYDDRLHILNNIEYFRIFIDTLNELCRKTIDCFKRSDNQIYDEQSNVRKNFIKFSLIFSHNLTELKSLFVNGLYEGERFRLTKQEAHDFWKNNFNDRTIIPWHEFKEKLNRVHLIQTVIEATALKNTIDLTNNNHVSIFEFDVFTRLFHPWSSLLTNWKLLAVTHPGFMAFMTYDEVKAILTSFIDKPGSYVFRLSCTRLGQWAIGYVTSENRILQTIPQTKPLIQSLIDGEREGYYKYPNGQHIHVDLSSALTSTESNRVFVSEEQYAIYCDIGSTFELCKICSVNNKDSKIEPCGHLICKECLIAWQNKNNSKPSALCPFCRSEIKGFEPIIIDRLNHSNGVSKNDLNLIDIHDTKDDINVDNLRTAANNHSDNNENIRNGNILFSDIALTPPPIPPRPVNIMQNLNRQSKEINSHLCNASERPLSLISSNDSISDSFTQPSTTSEVNSICIQNGTLSLSINDQFRTIDDVRDRLINENNFERNRIDAALILTHGLVLSKQYEIAKLFLEKIKYEHEQL